MVELDPCILGSKLPVDGGVGFIAAPLKGCHLAGECGVIGYPPIETLAAENVQLNLRHPFGKLRTGLSQLPCLGV